MMECLLDNVDNVLAASGAVYRLLRPTSIAAVYSCTLVLSYSRILPVARTVRCRAGAKGAALGPVLRRTAADSRASCDKAAHRCCLKPGTVCCATRCLMRTVRI
jgi:hypothetical protein